MEPPHSSGVCPIEGWFRWSDLGRVSAQILRMWPAHHPAAGHLKRECIAREKGDLIAWLLTVEGEALYPDGRVTGSVRAQE